MGKIPALTRQVSLGALGKGKIFDDMGVRQSVGDCESKRVGVSNHFNVFSLCMCIELQHGFAYKLQRKG